MSIKHYKQDTVITIAAAAVNNTVLAEAVNAPVAGTSNDVLEGSVIKAMFIEYWMQGQNAIQSSFNVNVEKRVAGAPAQTFANAINLYNYNNKKNVLYTSQGLIGGSTNNNGVPIIRQWIKIPRGKQRMGLGDKIVINFAAISDGMQTCGFSVYKEYR